MFTYETHMHTYPVSACAHATPLQQARAYADRGYAGVIVTDHFLNGNTSCPHNKPWEWRIKYFASGYEAVLSEGKKLGLDVFFGWEFCCSDGTEFLTSGLGIDFLLANPDMDRLGIAKYSDLVRSHGGYLAQAHPYRVGSWIANQYPVNPKHVDGIEVHNATMPNHTNKKALDFARRHNLAMQAGSDSHHADISCAAGVRLRERAGGIGDIIDAIRSGSAVLAM
jgi:hypothetical protein